MKRDFTKYKYKKGKEILCLCNGSLHRAIVFHEWRFFNKRGEQQVLVGLRHKGPRGWGTKYRNKAHTHIRYVYEWGLPKSYADAVLLLAQNNTRLLQG